MKIRVRELQNILRAGVILVTWEAEVGNIAKNYQDSISTNGYSNPSPTPKKKKKKKKPETNGWAQ
jgi:hypothetical protein